MLIGWYYTCIVNLGSVISSPPFILLEHNVLLIQYELTMYKWKIKQSINQSINQVIKHKMNDKV